jgi:dodecin
VSLWFNFPYDLRNTALPSAAPRADNGPGARRRGAGSSVGTSPSAKRIHDIPVLAGLAGPTQREASMSVARVTKLTASSTKGFQDAVQTALARAAKTLRGITGLEVLSQKAKVEKGKIAEYRVTMEVTFILD